MVENKVKYEGSFLEKGGFGMKKRIVALTALLVLLLSLCGCGNADTYYGAWEQTYPPPGDEPAVLRLYDNDTGTITNAAGETWLTYSVKEDIMSITMNETNAEKIQYTFQVEKDELTLTDKDGNKAKFKRLDEEE